ncbi:serine carboxypeptidase family protein (macronuclear) [Tetrahymena thermophila SB210]|uniref:Serine carboxypeptidase family protein n=1 Tax=Tetrahymena thermophila (strain SB210) TaxID=312017 RepID=Q234I0_TETTS|nr:serine carboxypeptidase family protein [Tetrahymena thermophila SB210]EAR92023.3 serine carboxypeptidase family protein [Tetrahymena thermophila SB210]|eukprot:XP_001012268.3 serine carboxypeptidase family protein [Tetrahymena thermophila SB210]
MNQFLRKIIGITDKQQKPTYSETYETECNKAKIKEYDGEVYSGFLKIKSSTYPSCIGYLFYGAKGIKKQDLNKYPTIIWLCGGPGMSSQNSNFNGIGPLYIREVNKDVFKKIKNENSWTNYFNLVFIDQPIGVGLSYVKIANDIPATLEQLANQFCLALLELYDNEKSCMKQLGISRTDNPLFIYGESFAGKYIPSIAEKIVKDGNQFNLVGVGLLDANIQPFYVMLEQNQYLFDLNLITEEKYQNNLLVIEAFKSPLSSKDNLTLRQVYQQYLNFTFKNVSADKIYNYKTCNKQFSNFNLDAFMNQQQTCDMFKLTLKEPYNEFFEESYNFLNWNIVQDSTPKIEFLLNNNIHVHIMNGDLDLLVPYKSQQQWIDRLNWLHAEKFKSMEMQTILNSKGDKISSSKQIENLTFDIVYESGHFICFDQPQSALMLLKKNIQLVLTKLNQIKQ